jgi:hypothetical protein
MNKIDGPRMRRLYLEWLVGALMIAGLVALVRGLF